MVCSSTVCSMSELNCLHYYDEYNLPFVNRTVFLQKWGVAPFSEGNNTNV